MARNNFRIIRFAVLAILVLLVVYKLSTQTVDMSSYQGALPVQGTTGGFDNSGKKTSGKDDGAAIRPGVSSGYQRENATIVTLARNSDLWDLVKSIRSVEDRFNRKYQYDWVFLNNDDFDDNFKKVTTALISGTTHYGKIPQEHWSYPDYIDQEKAKEARIQMGKDNIIYGDNEPYRHMCRFESGFFWRHPLMNKYKYYWRVEPSVEVFCDIDYDIFKFMSQNGKKYGFTISLYEYVATIETLWQTTVDFVNENPSLVHSNALKEFITDDDMQSYNLCHFWSNFEIADLDFWRGEAYTKYFDFLDKAGGFFYERWGDAPVHSIAAALFLDKSELHHFEDVGYYHVPFNQCPTDPEVRLKNKCACNPDQNFSWEGYSCTTRFYNAMGLERPGTKKAVAKAPAAENQ